MAYDAPDSTERSTTVSDIVVGTLVPANQLKDLKKAPVRGFGKTEVDVLPAIFAQHNRQVTLYSGHLANESDFKATASKAGGLLHISTHGFYNNDTSNTITGTVQESVLGAARRNALLDCGLAMAGINQYWMTGKTPENAEDGLLTGYEVAQLDMSEIDLVTLSACETGLGQTSANEGNMGLVRAFKLAGAKKVMASLWPVPAKQTAELMTMFYKNWLQNANPALALKNAQGQLLAKGYAPFFWAGFVLVE
jgi:CHAT domain-containing protein